MEAATLKHYSLTGDVNEPLIDVVFFWEGKLLTMVEG